MKSLYDFIFSIGSDLFHEVFVFSLVGFVLSIITLIVLKRTKLLSRKLWIHKFFVFWYYLYFPILFSFFGGFVGAVYGAHMEVKKGVHEVILPLSEMHIFDFQSYVDANEEYIVAGKKNINEIIEDFGVVELDTTDHGWWGDIKTSIANKFVPKIKEWTIKAALSSAEIVIEEAGEKVGFEEEMTEDMVKAIKTLDMKDLQDDFWGTIEKQINKQISKLFRGFYITVFTYFLFFMLIPIAEITISGIYFWRQRKNQAQEKTLSE